MEKKYAGSREVGDSGFRAKASKLNERIKETPENAEVKEYLQSMPEFGHGQPLGKVIKVIQCWRCKSYGHRTGDAACKYYQQGNINLEIERRIREDPMFQFNTVKSAASTGKLPQLNSGFGPPIVSDSIITKQIHNGEVDNGDAVHPSTAIHASEPSSLSNHRHSHKHHSHISRRSSSQKDHHREHSNEDGGPTSTHHHHHHRHRRRRRKMEDGGKSPLPWHSMDPSTTNNLRIPNGENDGYKRYSVYSHVGMEGDKVEPLKQRPLKRKSRYSSSSSSSSSVPDHDASD